MRKNKLTLVYKEDGQLKKESVWVTPVGKYFRIDNIPFFACNVALADLVEAELDEGELFFDRLVRASGHSTVQVVFFQPAEQEATLHQVEALGCSWEGSHLANYVALDVPSQQHYLTLQPLLSQLHARGILDYKEACLGFL